MTTVQSTIEDKLTATFAPEVLLVLNESESHRGPGAETHYNVTLVSDAFAGKRLLARHRAVNQALAEELAGPVHALALHTYTAAEWQERGGAPASPECAGATTAPAAD